MIQGPDLIYECPNCGNLLKNESLESGNNSGEKGYSDGKRVAHMLPEFPNLTKCKKCNEIFWIEKLVEIGTYDWSHPSNLKWKDVEYAEFLEIDDYFRALNTGICENEKEEFFIRKRIWWAYNDRVREDKTGKMYDDEKDEMRWKENILSLIKMFDITDITQKIMKAEAHRNLGEFESCMKIISDIDDKKYDWLKEKFENECKRKNTVVIELYSL